jgi:hypothetical protein
LIIYWEDIVEWVKTSDSWFAKLIRFAIYPLIKLFKWLGKAIDWVSERLSEMSEWIKTSDSWFAKFVRGVADSAVEFIKVIEDMFNWIMKLAEGAIKPLSDMIDIFSSETQKELGVNVNKKVNTEETVNPDASIKEADKSIQEKVMAKLGIDINDKTGQASISKNTGGIPVNLTKTLGWQ